MKPERVQFWKMVLELLARAFDAIAGTAEDAGGSDGEPTGKIEE